MFCFRVAVYCHDQKFYHNYTFPSYLFVHESPSIYFAAYLGFNQLDKVVNHFLICQLGICKAFISRSKYIIDLTYFSAITTKQQREEKHSRNNIIQTIATTVSYFYDTPCFYRNNEYCKDISTYKPFDESCLKINDGSLLMTGDKFLCEYVNKTLLIFISIYNI